MRFYTAVAIATLAFSSAAYAPAAQAQTKAEGVEVERKDPRFEAGISVLGAAPTADFAAQVDRAFGVGTYAAYRFDGEGRFRIRLDASWLAHGWEREDVPVRSPFGDTRTLEMSTINSLIFVGAGPEFVIPVGSVRPYVGVNAGITAFTTNASAADWNDGIHFATSVEKRDVAFAYGGRAGIRIPTPIGSWPVAIDFGGQYLHSDEAEFLREGDLSVDDSGTIMLNPVRANADTWIFHAGISVSLGRSEASK